MPQIAIIVLNWQQSGLTIDTINSLKRIRHSHFDYHIYLVDNGSRDDCPQIFSQKYRRDPRVSLILSPHNLGFSAGNNLGIKAALKQKFDYILLINSDVVVDPMVVENLLRPFSADPQVAMVGPKIYFAPGFEFHKDRYRPSEIGKVIWSAGGSVDWRNVYTINTGIDEVDRGQYDQTRLDLEFITNCCVLIKSSALSDTGLMPEEYFMYCEDADFCQQFYRHGYRLAYEPSAVIWHRNSGSSQAGGGPFHDYFLTRNRLIFGKKYASFRANFALFRESLRLLLFKGTPWQKRGVIDFYLGRYGQGSWR